MLDATAARQPSFDRQTHRLPRLHVHILAQGSRAESGAKHAIITVCTNEFPEAHTVYELAKSDLGPGAQKHRQSWRTFGNHMVDAATWR